MHQDHHKGSEGQGNGTENHTGREDKPDRSQRGKNGGTRDHQNRSRGEQVGTTLDAIVSGAVQDDMLVSCADLITLRAIPKGFPNTQIVECRKLGTRDPKEVLLEEFPGVLSDELNLSLIHI